MTDSKPRTRLFAGRTAALLAAAALAAAACGNAGNERGRGGGLSGAVSGDGSSTVFPITEAVAEEFGAGHPEVRVTVGVSGTGGGFKKFCNGETDFQNASRAIEEDEAADCAQKGIEYEEFEVALDGLAVVVNPSNDWVECLTTDELSRIWAPGSSVANWKEVRSSFPAEPVKLYGPGTDSGTFDYFTNAINGEEGASRSDYTASEDDNTLVQGVAGAAGALGYFGFAYFVENKDKLKLLAVDGGDGCVVPSNATVQSGEYKPLSRPLFLYVKKSAMGRPEAREFAEFYLGNVSKLVDDVGYTALSEERLAEQKKKLEELVAG